ncbi:hybrid sensor histidine kinase/response regulator [Acanthopleuribacter pedis]|uniref:histidine kinase n=1 Tax=Acanthopleuribacter pedis TaxID=442870 RepID=A0A8J7Q425_9BACT|nr:hybrid sensor histidine kinase/response regulator [Acanthopleuribacter pedis]MBO1318870.1 response regulator [Acanthopleuribacter pedis]
MNQTRFTELMKFFATHLIRAMLMVPILVGLFAHAANPTSPPLIAEQAGELKFKTYTNRDGLSQNSVLAITQDTRGFMWFGTRDGLNRFDGYSFKVFYTQTGNPNSLANNYIRSLLADPDGGIWVGTQNGGLSKYDPRRDLFQSYATQSAPPMQLPGDFVADLAFDHDGGLLIATDGGLAKLSKDRKRIDLVDLSSANLTAVPFVRAVHLTDDGTLWIGTDLGLLRRTPDGSLSRFRLLPEHARSYASINRLAGDDSGDVWIATFEGAFHYSAETRQVTQYLPNENDPGGLSHREIFTAHLDGDGRVWLGTQNGLNRFNRETQTFSATYHRNYLPDSLGSNEIWSMFSDQQGNLWVGTYNGGISLYAPLRQRFTHFQHDPENPTSLGGQEVWSVFVDDQRRLWVGSYDGGLSRYHSENNRFSHIRHDPNKADGLSENSIWALNQDKDGRLWIGTRATGLNVGTPEEGFKHYRHQPDAPNTLPHNRIYAILRDHRDRMWVGTRKGLARYRPNGDDFVTFYHQPSSPSSLAHDRIYNLYEDREQRLWAATLNGLSRLKEDETGFTNYRRHGDAVNSLSSNVVSSMYHDQEGKFWVGTYQGGLNKWPAADFKQGRAHFTHYGHNQGLPSEAIYALTGDRLGRIWMSTNQGLACFDPQKERFQSYTIAEGTQDNEFKNGFFHDFETNTVFFGGINGLNGFQPDQMMKNTFVPPIVISNLTVTRFTKQITVLLGDQRHLTFDYDDQALKLELAALDYTDPKRNRYAYHLEGLQAETIQLGNQRHLSFANLPSGKYTLHVFGSNNDGLWNEVGTTLNITIRPPPWASRGAVAAYMLLALVAVYCVWRYQIRRIEDQAQIESLKQTDQAKSMFIAHVSHELRTPMNGVIGMADILGKMDLEPRAREYIDIIRHSGESLLAIINDILDLSKMNENKMLLETIPFFLRRECDAVIDLFSEQALKKQVALRQWIGPDVPNEMLGDPLRLRQVLTNLLSNALKFTEHGHIELRIALGEQTEDQAHLNIEVEDTGIGIPPDRLQLLFKPFQQVDSSTTRKYGGTGLGLTICERLVRKMGGRIRVHSQVNQGSTFQFNVVLGMPKDSKPSAPAVQTNQWMLLWEPDPRDRDIAEAQLLYLGFGVHHLHQPDPRALTVKEPPLPGEIVGLWWGCSDQEPGVWSAWQTFFDDTPASPGPRIILSGAVDPRDPTTPDGIAFVPRPLRFKNTEVLFAPPAAPRDQEHPRAGLSAPMWRLLLVEDNTVNQKVAMRMLEQLGLQCDLAVNGKQALIACEKTPYDLILMDCQMPEMDGLEATRQLRARHEAHQPIIVALTANASQEDRVACITAGMNDFLTKPLKRADLMEVLEKWAPAKEPVMPIR